jgi:hypothetical protein
MQALDYGDGFRITVAEMSRRSQLTISSWFNDWLTGSGDTPDKLKTVSAISTQVILHSRIALHRNGEKLPEGTYALEDGVTVTLPLTEDSLNDLPASLVAWLIDAAGKENPLILGTFLAATRVLATSGQKTLERLSASGPPNAPKAP